MSTPLVTVVTPVYNQLNELPRALHSLVGQTFDRFECIVVDDASDISPESVVEQFDDRFVLVRREKNGGCTAARMDGYERMRGEILLLLDSDNEFFPWTLERAYSLLKRDATVGGVAGLFVFPDGLRVRVSGGSRVITKEDYAGGVGGPFDMVGAVRRDTVDEWLQRSRDYYNCDLHYWVSHQISRSVLWVDEPWGRYHTDADTRITLSGDPRRLRDPALFVTDYRPVIGTKPCIPVDRYLQASWRQLQAAHRPEAALVADWMRERGLDPQRRKVTRDLPGRLRRRLANRIAPPVVTV